MCSKAETVAGRIRRIRKMLKPEAGNRVSADYGELMVAFDRIEAANRREVAELRECVEQAVWDRCAKCTIRAADYEDIVNGYAKCEHDGCECQKWRKALEMTGARRAGEDAS